MTQQSSKFPSEAEVVIVGVGGIVGSMVAYWLAELGQKNIVGLEKSTICLLYTSPSPRDKRQSRMPSSA